MPNKKQIDIKSLSKELESLIDVTGDSCGPLLINELQARIDKTVEIFNKDVDKILSILFNVYHDRRENCKKILDNNSSNNFEDDIEEKEVVSPQFIKSYENKNKL
tara:strand:- start:145 stop:459 length:315 start_codon:yes stop_codon:yes gene_type:complete